MSSPSPLLRPQAEPAAPTLKASHSPYTQHSGRTQNGEAPSARTHLIHSPLSSAGQPGEDQTKEHTQGHDDVGDVGDDQGGVNHRFEPTGGLLVNHSALEGQEDRIPGRLHCGPDGFCYFILSSHQLRSNYTLLGQKQIC